ncbi:MAG: peptidoglycan D,D-transpeptidase FtsI family protein [Ilumatobacteraceae bacterium]
MSDSRRTTTATRTRTHGRVAPAPAPARARRAAQPARRAPQPARPVQPARPDLRAKRVPKPKKTTPAITVTFRAGDMRRRMQVAFVVIALLFTAVIARVAFLQTVGGETLVEAGRAQRVSESVLLAQRGTIFASDGGELAISVPATTIFADPTRIGDADATVRVLAAMLSLPPDRQKKLLAAFEAKDKSFVYVARQIDDETAAAVMALNLPGIDTTREDKRTMPSGEVGKSILGRTDIDGTGTAGLELQYDSLLKGIDGERIREHDKNGRSIPGAGATTIEPQAGTDLVLTIDRSLQFQVEQLLLQRVDAVKGQGGTVVVMEPGTGNILAVANVERDKDKQLHITSANKAVVEPFEPGSVAKVFSLSAVVDAGIATPKTMIDVPGKMVFNKGTQWEQTINDAEPHNTVPMSLRDILVHSSNLGTYLLASQLGPERLATYLDKFGFGHKTALNFPGETKGIIDPASKWEGTEKVTVTYGYHYQASAVQFTAAVNAVANHGVYVAPRLLQATIGADGKVSEAPASDTHEVISSAAATTMTDLMKGVVCEGTGKDARIPDISVAGKTGTAYKTVDGGGYGDKTNRKYRASFAGFFPADDPKLTILVSIDEPDPTSADRFGGKAAAPLFASVATAAIHELTITPSPGDTGCKG